MNYLLLAIFIISLVTLIVAYWGYKESKKIEKEILEPNKIATMKHRCDAPFRDNNSIKLKHKINGSLI